MSRYAGGAGSVFCGAWITQLLHGSSPGIVWGSCRSCWDLVCETTRAAGLGMHHRAVSCSHGQSKELRAPQGMVTARLQGGNFIFFLQGSVLNHHEVRTFMNEIIMLQLWDHSCHSLKPLPSEHPIGIIKLPEVFAGPCTEKASLSAVLMDQIALSLLH